MRKYIDINLGKKSVTHRELHGREIAECGRYLIAKMLLEQNIAEVAPLAPENLLIFSAGPFAGTNFSNANRLSVGCKSPLTCLLYTSPSPRDMRRSRMPSSA